MKKIIFFVLVIVALVFTVGCAAKSPDEIAAENIFGPESVTDNRAACQEAKTLVKQLTKELNALQDQIADTEKAADTKLHEHTLAGDIYSKGYKQPEERNALNQEWKQLATDLGNMKRDAAMLAAKLSMAEGKRDRLCQ